MNESSNDEKSSNEVPQTESSSEEASSNETEEVETPTN